VALSFAIWERQVLQPAARTNLGTEVTAIDHYGFLLMPARLWRRHGASLTARHGQRPGRGGLSPGGRAADHRGRDWDDAGPEGRFLREVRDGACRTYETVLGPSTMRRTETISISTAVPTASAARLDAWRCAPPHQFLRSENLAALR
jgi:hypothetical protein